MNDVIENRKAKQKEYRRNLLLRNPNYDREYYQKRKASGRTSREWSLENSERHAKSRKEWNLKFPWRKVINSARSRCCRNKNIPFDLTPEWGEARWTGFCELTALPFKLDSNKIHPYSPSIDRIDPSLGYIQGNCRFVLFGINALKGSGTDEDAYCIASSFILNKKDSE